jgi:hypothetical protein
MKVCHIIHYQSICGGARPKKPRTEQEQTKAVTESSALGGTVGMMVGGPIGALIGAVQGAYYETINFVYGKKDQQNNARYNIDNNYGWE